MAIGDINAEPPYTNFSLNNFPSAIETTVVLGATVFALISEAVLQVGEAFSYSDNGISLNINLAQGYQSMAQMLLNGYVQGKTNIKRAMRPKAASLASGAGGPPDGQRGGDYQTSAVGLCHPLARQTACPHAQGGTAGSRLYI